MNRHHFEALRRRSSPVENALIDEFLAARIDRRSFLRHATVLGFGAAFLTSLLPRPLIAAAKTGGHITVGMPVPAGRVDPLTVSDTGGVCLASQTGEYLAVSDGNLQLQPVLAESWKPNADGSIWTFKIRRGVTFHDGQTLTAADVAATMNRLADPANGSVALSAFAGALSKGGARSLDEGTVEFQLDAPNGSFPYLVSSDNFNALILPANYAGNFEKHFIGTGPFRLEKFTPKAGASFVRNDAYWGAKALPDRSVFTFYDSTQAQVLAMQGGQLNVLLHVSVQGSQALLADPALDVVALKSSAHNQVHMRTDEGPFADKRIRRAVALCLNRKNLISGMFRGHATLGNDSPFAPLYAATDPSVAQREQDIAQAKALLAAAGRPNGFKATLTTERFQEIPDLAVIIQNAVRKIGIDLTLRIEDQAAYYGRATFGQSDWLDCTLGITDYGHRGVPNTTLSASLGSKGTFNAAHFKSPPYDRLVADYIAAIDPAQQRETAGAIQRLLLDETPIIVPYFYDWLSVTSKDIRNVRPTAIGQLFLGQAHWS
ncbi:MAG: ABC transporter substrate-binding protein [Pseudomonadota bacterium]|nr:ABC transporter substrate-binding protein [Pseudomonadota bacterium]